MEEWKDIEGYEGIYQISNEGKVKSLQREITYKDGRKKVIQERILHNFLSDIGYYHVMLSKNGISKRYKVHRLVAKEFIPNPGNLPVINHKDENKENNLVFVNEDGSVDLEKSNLEWCTQGYNVRYGTMIERGRQTQFNRPDKSKEVEQYTLEGELVETFKSASEVERKYPQFNKGSVSRCCRGGQMLNGKWQTITSYKGYMWRYKNE